MTTKPAKPLEGRAYPRIGHLPHSKYGKGDFSASDGIAKILLKESGLYRIIVQEKLDGSCVSVLKKDGQLLPLIRAGYLARTSPYEMHHLFADWVEQEKKRFDKVLSEGEWIAGEWIAQAHGTMYYIAMDPFIAFDIFKGKDNRLNHDDFTAKVKGVFDVPVTLHDGKAIGTKQAMELHEKLGHPCDKPEGVVYRAERDGKFKFAAKYVRRSKENGTYLKGVSGQPYNIWLWHPSCHPAAEKMFGKAWKPGPECTEIAQ